MCTSIARTVPHKQIACTAKDHSKLSLALQTSHDNQMSGSDKKTRVKSDSPIVRPFSLYVTVGGIHDYVLSIRLFFSVRIQCRSI